MLSPSVTQTTLVVGQVKNSYAGHMMEKQRRELYQVTISDEQSQKIGQAKDQGNFAGKVQRTPMGLLFQCGEGLSHCMRHKFFAHMR